MSEIPVHFRPRRLADWLNPTGARKVHSLIDKIYQRKNLELAWERVKANRGSGGVDGQSLEAYGAMLDEQLERLQGELREATVLGVKSSAGRGPRCPQGPPALGTREISRRWTCGQRGFAEFKRFPGMTHSTEYRF
jgi:hypothetical protein